MKKVILGLGLTILSLNLFAAESCWKAKEALGSLVSTQLNIPAEEFCINSMKVAIVGKPFEMLNVNLSLVTNNYTKQLNAALVKTLEDGTYLVQSTIESDSREFNIYSYEATALQMQYVINSAGEVLSISKISAFHTYNADIYHERAVVSSTDYDRK